MRILLLASAFNSLTERVCVELDDLGHDVGVGAVCDGQQKRVGTLPIGQSQGPIAQPRSVVARLHLAT